MKKIVVLGMAATLSCFFSVSAIAGTWEQEDTGVEKNYRYIKDDGDYAKNEWIQDADGVWYHFGQNGIMQSNQWTEDGYWVNGRGKMETNIISKDGYYVGDDGRAVLNSDQLKDAYDNHVELRNSQGALVDVYYQNSYEGKKGLAFHVDSIELSRTGDLLANLTRTGEGGKYVAIQVMGREYRHYTGAMAKHTGWYALKDAGEKRIYRKQTQDCLLNLLACNESERFVIYLGKPRIQ